MCILLGLEIRTYSNIDCRYSDMINYKIIKDDGNFILTIFEFKNSYYIIDYSTS